MARDANEIFRQAVDRYLSYLVARYDFRRINTEEIGAATTIRFESPSIYVSLRYGPPSFEARLRFGRIGVDDQSETYSFESGDLILLDSCSGWSWESHCSDRVEGEVAWLARILDDCGRPCLLGDQEVYEEMRARRHLAVTDWRQQENLRVIRQRASQAWGLKNYSEIARLLESLGEAITPLERRQLEYAKKHLGTPPGKGSS